MGQMIDKNSIINIDAKALSAAGGNGQGVGILSSKDNGSINAENNSAYAYEKNNTSVNAYDGSAMFDNFKEYLEEKKEAARENGQDEEAKKQEEKEAAKEIAQNISGEELAKLRMMGINVDSAKLSDLMGVVSNMRLKEHEVILEQVVNNITVDARDIDNDMPQTNASSAETMPMDFPIGDTEILYLIKNDLDYTSDNLYKAHYSGMRLVDSSDINDTVEVMMSQIENVFNEAGYDLSDENVDVAKTFINNNIPLTTDNVVKYKNYIQGIGNVDINEKADSLYKMTRDISLDAVYDMTKNGKTVTIAAAASYSAKYIGNLSDNSAVINDSVNSIDAKLVEGALDKDNTAEAESIDRAAITARRQMEEIRLSMTYQAAARLVKMDINIDTRSIDNVIKALRDMENADLKYAFESEGVELNDVNYEMLNNVNEGINSLASAHAKVLAAPLGNTAFTINGLNEAVSNDIDYTGTSFESVKRSYEAVGTAPRYDMGDSIKKAFSNIEDILTDMGLDASEDNIRAVRILGYNSIEITEDNIDKVAMYDRQVNELIDSFYPEAVLGMIRDGINPMDVPIDELVQEIRDRNYNEGVSDVDNFAAYLRNLDNMKEITPEERESYIGIYRMVNKLAKSGNREAGWLFANQGRLTVRNLISAMRSEKSTGIDVSVDKDFGMISDLEVSGNRIDEQIQSAFEKAVKNPQTIAFMEDNNIEETMINYTAVEQFVNNDGGIYKMVYDIMSKLKFDMDVKEDEIDEETENISNSLSGEDVVIDFSMDSILALINENDDLALRYEDLRDRIIEGMYATGIGTSLSTNDMATIKTVNAGLNVMSNMARTGRYQIPMNESETGIINLTVKQSDSVTGSIDITYPSNEYGTLEVQIRIDNNGIMQGYIISDSSENNYKIMGIKDAFKGFIDGNGFDADAVTVGTISVDSKVNSTSDVNRDVGEKPSDRRIYQAAVTLVQAINHVVNA